MRPTTSSVSHSQAVAEPPKPAQPKQPVTDLLGDLGGDPFAQSAGIVYYLACEHF